MKIYKEISLSQFEPWSGAVCRFNELTGEELDQLEEIFEELYPDGTDETTVNDIFWFEEDWIAEQLGYKDWEHLERDHAGISDEDHARQVIEKEYPNPMDELAQAIDKFIEEELDEDWSDDEIIDNFNDYWTDYCEQSEEENEQ